MHTKKNSSPCTGSLRVRWAHWKRTECAQSQSSLQPVATQVLASLICEDTFLSHHSVKRGPANSPLPVRTHHKTGLRSWPCLQKENIQEQKMLITDILILFASPGLLFWKLTYMLTTWIIITSILGKTSVELVNWYILCMRSWWIITWNTGVRI